MIVPIELVLHVVEVRVPLAIVLVQHEDAHVVVGVAAPLVIMCNAIRITAPRVLSGLNSIRDIRPPALHTKKFMFRKYVVTR